MKKAPSLPFYCVHTFMRKYKRLCILKLVFFRSSQALVKRMKFMVRRENFVAMRLYDFDDTFLRNLVTVNNVVSSLSN